LSSRASERLLQVVVSLAVCREVLPAAFLVVLLEDFLGDFRGGAAQLAHRAGGGPQATEERLNHDEI